MGVGRIKELLQAGLLRKLTGDHAGAALAFIEALELEPGNARALEGLAELRALGLEIPTLHGAPPASPPPPPRPSSRPPPPPPPTHRVTPSAAPPAPVVVPAARPPPPPPPRPPLQAAPRPPPPPIPGPPGSTASDPGSARTGLRAPPIAPASVAPVPPPLPAAPPVWFVGQSTQAPGSSSIGEGTAGRAPASSISAPVLPWIEVDVTNPLGPPEKDTAIFEVQSELGEQPDASEKTMAFGDPRARQMHAPRPSAPRAPPRPPPPRLAAPPPAPPRPRAAVPPLPFDVPVEIDEEPVGEDKTMAFGDPRALKMSAAAGAAPSASKTPRPGSLPFELSLARQDSKKSARRTIEETQLEVRAARHAASSVTSAPSSPLTDAVASVEIDVDAPEMPDSTAGASEAAAESAAAMGAASLPLVETARAPEAAAAGAPAMGVDSNPLVEIVSPPGAGAAGVVATGAGPNPLVVIARAPAAAAGGDAAMRAASAPLVEIARAPEAAVASAPAMAAAPNPLIEIVRAPEASAASALARGAAPNPLQVEPSADQRSPRPASGHCESPVANDALAAASHGDSPPRVVGHPEPTATVAPAADRARHLEALLAKAVERLDLDDHSGALEAVAEALTVDPAHPRALEISRRCEATLLAMVESKLGDLGRIPRRLLRDDEIFWLNLDHRAGFLLSMVDGNLTFEDLFAISGMPRLDTAKLLARLVQDRIIG